MINTSEKIRTIVKANPEFGEFLISKGFPLNLKNPVTAFVSFDDVAKMRNIDKDAFLKEYEKWISER